MKRILVLAIACLLSYNLLAVVHQYRCSEADIYQICFRDGDLMIATKEYGGYPYLFDVSDPENIVELSFLNFHVYHSYMFHAVIKGDYLVTTYVSSLIVYDISDITSPELVVEENLYSGGDNGGYYDALAISDNHILYCSSYYDYDEWEEYYVNDLWDISDPTNPVLLPSYVCSDVDDVVIKDNIVYAAKNSVVRAYDISDPDNIVQISQVDADGFLYIRDNYLFASSWDEDVLISIDISDPVNPVRLDDIPIGVGRVEFSDDLAIVYYYDTSTKLIDISDPNHLELICSYGSVMNGVIDLGNQRLKMLDNGFWRYIDYSDPENYRLVSVFSDYELNEDYVEDNYIKKYGDYLYIVQYSDIWIVDYRDIANPELVLDMYSQYRPLDIDFIDDIIYMSKYGMGIILFDNSDPENPVEIDNYSPYGFDTFKDIEIVDHTIYLTSEGHIVVLDATDPEDLSMITSIETPIGFDRIIWANQFLYAWNTENVLQVYDASANTPVLRCTILPGVIQDVCVMLNYLYVTTESSIKVYNLLDPAAPIHTDTITMDGGNQFGAAYRMESELIVADNMWNRLLLFDLTSPEHPALSNSYCWNQSTSQIFKQSEYLILNNRYGGISVLKIEAVDNDEDEIPRPEFALTNYPNPFNPQTTISYSIQEDNHVNLQVYNIKGQLVRTLVNQMEQKGNHSVVWTGKDDQGKSVSSGVYLYRLSSGTTNLTKKMLLLQ